MHIYIPMDRDNNVVKARVGSKARWRGKRWGKWGTSVIVSTIEKEM